MIHVRVVGPSDVTNRLVTELETHPGVIGVYLPSWHLLLIIAGLIAAGWNLHIGFALAIAVTLVFALCIRALGIQSHEFELGIRPVSNLIDTPNAYSVIVATLAGIVGVVSLTEARANTLIGVFVSVATIPAAADIGVSSAFGSWSEARGSLVQLLLNIGTLIVIGAIGLAVQQRTWDRVHRVFNERFIRSRARAPVAPVTNSTRTGAAAPLSRGS